MCKSYIKKSIYTVVVFILIQICFKTYAQENNWQRIDLNSEYITTIETVKNAVLAGENDYAPWLGRYNGVFMSKNYGESWEKFGLEGRGVTDIFYDNGKVYATTKYAKEGQIGLFTKDIEIENSAWSNVEGVNFPGNKVVAVGEKILYGTTNHGLWASKDSGQTWIQEIGAGYYGPEIIAIFIKDSEILVGTTTGLWRFNNEKTAWEKDIALGNSKISTIESLGNTIYVGTQNNEGMYKANSTENSWVKIESWGNKSVGKIYEFRGNIYATGKDLTGKQDIFRMEGGGETWKALGLNLIDNTANIRDLAAEYGAPSFLYTAGYFDGVSRLSLENFNSESKDMLEIPWAYSDESELLDTITSYFDHEYPLLGYSYHKEETSSETTLNFLGIKEGIPEVYYSSHNGIDFELPYGTHVKAPAEGYATYTYCTDCGHTIKIDHQNGYETTYMHLQLNEIYTTNQIPKHIQQGTILGKIGLSGKTTGPHLHFGVIKDVDQDGVFLNDWPEGLIDPFGWQLKDLRDPWEYYVWNDVLGNHTGSKSEYLWKTKVSYVEQNIRGVDYKEVVNKNKKIQIAQNEKEITTVQILNYFKPNKETIPKNLAYIKNTAVLINLFDNFGNIIHEIQEPAIIEIDYGNLLNTNIIENSLNIYHWNEELNIWEVLERISIDTDKNIITAKTSKFSKFSVLGQVIDFDAPTTRLYINGIKNEGNWYIEPPEISFDTQEENTTTYFLIDGRNDWELYETPNILENEETYFIKFRSVDNANNWENIKSEIIKIGNPLNTGAEFKNATFTISALQNLNTN